MGMIFLPDPERMRLRGFDAVANVPLLFGPDFKLCREHSRYLRDRAQGLWSTGTSATHLKRVRAPAHRSVMAAAEALQVWIRWCFEHKKDWSTVVYDDVLTFQNAMISGRWSLSGKPLAASTANHRADEATAFLEWAGVHQLRDPFEVPRMFTSRTFVTGASIDKAVRQYETRIGRAREARAGDFAKMAWLPKREAIRTWLDSVKAERGIAKYLAAKFIIETGTRLQETVSLPVTAIPSREEILEAAQLGRTTLYVKLTQTKGGVPRQVPVALAFLDELRSWIDKRRMMLAAHQRRLTGEPPKSLFLSDRPGYIGIPISGNSLYKVFKEVTPPSRQWHPHMGRHAFACYYILDAVTADAKAKGSTLQAMGVEWVNSTGELHLLMLRRHLGHVDQKTTETYLRWLVTASSQDDVHSKWHSFLSNGD